MSTLDATPTGPQAPARRAQTVAPVQASALQLAAAVLGEGGYVPEQRIGAALTASGRGPDAVRPEPVRPEPVRPEPVRPEPVRPEPVQAAPDRPEADQPRPGFFARLWRRLLGR